ncbi:Obg-like ATPase [Acrasis kona]|uniref:Obg-like ATPase homolog n=1 Tax=Acrasis kona TaxID=1008807 RepID=A0AAW2YY42_9EUKA
MPPKKAETVENNVVRFGRVKNNLNMGVVGLPNVGKSSLFNLLTEQSVAAENYPFCTIDTNVARCPVPDTRYDFLCDLWAPPSCYPAYLMVTDIAGLIKGASEGAGLGNTFLSHIQAVDGIFHVVRAFENDDVVHVEDSVDPVRDLETIQNELCKKDLEILVRNKQAEEANVRKSGGAYKLSPLFNDTFAKIKEMLEKNIPVRDGTWSSGEIELINEKTQLITTKPVIYLINLTQTDFIRKKNKWLAKIHKWVTEHGGGTMIPFSVEFETNLWKLKDKPEEKESFLKEHGATSNLPKIITNGYTQLGLIYYFTAGETEVRCWTIREGCLAPQAAGVIHSDFERGFIKAEVCAFNDFKELCGGRKGMAEIKAAGKYRQEGKTYVVQDGDIIHFQFNVTAQKKK